MKLRHRDLENLILENLSEPKSVHDMKLLLSEKGFPRLKLL